MKRIYCFLKDYKKECVLAPLFKMTEAVFELFVPLVIAWMIDKGIQQADQPVLVGGFICLLLLGAVGLAVSITAQYFSARAATGFATKLRQQLFHTMMNFSYTDIDHIGTATMITRMTSDVNQAQTGVNMFLRLFLRSPFVVFGAMVMAFTIDAKCAMTFVLAILLLGIVIFLITVKNIQMIGKVQEKLDVVLRKVRENLTGVRVLRAFCMEEKETERFHEANQSLTVEQKRAGGVAALLNPLTYILINCAIILLIHTGSIQVSLGNLTQGQVVALYNYMSQILVELVKLANLIVTLSKASASAKRIAAVLEEAEQAEQEKETAEAERENPVCRNPSAYLSFEKAGLTYQGNAEPSLTDISFTVKKGQTVGIIGGTGSGKTSLVHLIPRFYEATEGAVFLEGKNINSYSAEELRKKVAVVMQKSQLFSGSIRDNLKLRDGEAADEELKQAVSIAQASDVVEGKGGLDGMISQNGRNLSGGQRQRLCIARALVGSPEILILDDSSSALDALTDANLRKALRSQKEKMTTFIVSQRTASIKDADVILVLEEGELAGSGTHSELLKTSATYREIYESQYQNKNGQNENGNEEEEEEKAQ